MLINKTYRNSVSRDKFLYVTLLDQVFNEGKVVRPPRGPFDLYGSSKGALSPSVRGGRYLYCEIN